MGLSPSSFCSTSSFHPDASGCGSLSTDYVQGACPTNTPSPPPSDEPWGSILEPNFLHSSLQQSLLVILWLAVFSRLMSVFPWQAGPRHLAHHCGLIQWLAYSRCSNTSRWKSTSLRSLQVLQQAGCLQSLAAWGVVSWLGGGGVVAWGGRAALQGPDFIPQVPHLHPPPCCIPLVCSQ